MKQNITISQLNELTDQGKEKLRAWWEPKMYDLYVETAESISELTRVAISPEYTIDRDFRRFKVPVLPLLSIGQMIQFLYENVTVVIESEERESPQYGWTVGRMHHDKELCDALWEQVKKLLHTK